MKYSVRKRKALRPATSLDSCFYCFQRGKRCDRTNGTACCSNCRPRVHSRAEIKNAPSFVESEVQQPLRNLVDNSQPFSYQPEDSIFCSLVFAIVTEHKPRNKKMETHEVDHSMGIDEPFCPGSLALRETMDTFVWAYLSLQMQCTDKHSHLVHLASLAGGYLSLMFPMVKEESLDSEFGANEHAEKHVTKFCLLRFAALLEDVMVPLRTLDTVESEADHPLNIIAAAGTLYCEVEHVVQGFQSGKLRLLCTDLELEASLRQWLKSIARELLARLQKTCAIFPVWAAKLVPPRKGAKRNFNIRNISVRIESCSPPLSRMDTGQDRSSPVTHTLNTPSTAATKSSPYTTPEESSAPYMDPLKDQHIEEGIALPNSFAPWYSAINENSAIPLLPAIPYGSRVLNTFQHLDQSHREGIVPDTTDGLNIDLGWEQHITIENAKMMQEDYLEDTYNFPMVGGKFAVTPPSRSLPPITSTAETQLSFEQPFHVAASSTATTTGKMVFAYDWSQNPTWE